jgi:DNA-binding NarL/FixJ family response regulator
MIARPVSAALRGRSVLVVEDQFLIAEEMRRAVENLGGQVVGPVSSVDEAMSLVRRLYPDIGLLDVDLHGREIYPVADALIEAGSPVIFTTGFDRAAMPAAYQDVPHLDKPVTTHALVVALSALQPSVRS